VDVLEPIPEDALEGLRRRVAVLEGVVAALDHFDEVGTVVSQCQDRSQARAAIVGLGYNELQADSILDLSLSRRTAEGRRFLAEELQAARELLNQQER